MKIDIHRHAKDPGTADRVLRNLFHYEADQIEKQGVYSAGLHPWHLKSESLLNDLEDLEVMLGHEEVIAVGEAGLDKSINVSMDLQMTAFREQIELAARFEKPMIIHCVRAYNEVFELRRKSGQKKPWIIHWFNASAEMGLQLVSHGFYLSFGHVLFSERSKAYRAFADIPFERIFLETDDSAWTIDQVYEKAAHLRNISMGKLEKVLANNFKTCFGRKA